MKGLTGVLSSRKLLLAREATALLFEDHTKFTTPEALFVYEQNMLDESVLLRICSEEYGVELSTPTPQYVPRELTEEYRRYDCVPIRYDTRTSTMYVGVLPELDQIIPDIRSLTTSKIYVPIYYYVQLYARYYGRPPFLHTLPVADKFELIVCEALELGAADITLTTVAEGASVYYNVRKKKVRSHRVLTREDISDLAAYITGRGGTVLSIDTHRPRYLSIPLGLHHRGRVVINRTHYGYSITIRVLSDDVLTSTLEELNVAPTVCNFIRDKMLSREKGLRLFIGETMSGKNTTILAALQELAATDRYKIVSVENPVETLVEGVEQIDVETPEEFEENTASLLRQNPDIVYITEITDYTAKSTMQTANTGKVVFSTIHANSISDVLSRLMDITGLSSDRLVLSLHSCCYQELVRDEENDRVYPVNRCVYFTDDLRARLYGKSIGECKQILQEVEAQWQ